MERWNDEMKYQNERDFENNESEYYGYENENYSEEKSTNQGYDNGSDYSQE